ncbi:TPA: hypothetical protein N0F65_004879 [Lagenidium giganteum]|uniref:C2H2-type domain-containing protein n=1 Tax=Lagenidium giganteum TaxID=4803 RepID=A0AAV2Z801_9STRA|nr:TPA: hypothetical protein N0F65_004879 [Lagenidium giganteum]
MARNKHKNGIICTFPGCDKVMRTQKFKVHYMKNHLREGEEYSVEHRKQYEVARDDSEALGAPMTTAQATPTPMADMKTEAPNATAASLLLPTELMTGTESNVDAAERRAYDKPLVNDVASAVNGLSAEEAPASAPSVGSKRPLQDAVLYPSAEMNMLDLAVFLDKRFEQLVNKMDEMVATQHELIQLLRAGGHVPMGEEHLQAADSAATAAGIDVDESSHDNSAKKRKRQDSTHLF